jgi:hypothetical protein
MLSAQCKPRMVHFLMSLYSLRWTSHSYAAFIRVLREKKTNSRRSFYFFFQHRQLCCVGGEQGAELSVPQPPIIGSLFNVARNSVTALFLIKERSGCFATTNQPITGSPGSPRVVGAYQIGVSARLYLRYLTDDIDRKQIISVGCCFVYPVLHCLILGRRCSQLSLIV